MSNNITVVIVGTGAIAKEYCKIVKAMNISPIVIGRSAESAKLFEEELQIPVITGGIEVGINELEERPTHAIVAVNINQLYVVTKTLLEHGVKNILVEKPAGLYKDEIQKLSNLANAKDSKVYVAYNRRFYASTERALSIIEEDGGVSSFNFEFTEWGHVIKETKHPIEVKEEWFLANSTHVVDLAFFIGGNPIKICTFAKDSLDWHSKAAVFAGAGMSDKGALFSYQANWKAPGRWGVEILTEKHRLYLRPMEKLAIQNIGSVAVNSLEIDDELDKLYKPGFYKQTESFLNNLNDGKKITICEQLEHMAIYQQIVSGN